MRAQNIFLFVAGLSLSFCFFANGAVIPNSDITYLGYTATQQGTTFTFDFPASGQDNVSFFFFNKAAGAEQSRAKLGDFRIAGQGEKSVFVPNFFFNDRYALEESVSSQDKDSGKTPEYRECRTIRAGFSCQTESLKTQPGKRLPLRIMLVLDRSQTMEKSIPQLRQAVRDFLSQSQFLFAAGIDQVGIITFADKAALEADFTSDTGKLLAVSENIKAYGGTNMGQAIAAAKDRLKNFDSLKYRKVLILLTDGMPSLGKALTDNCFATSDWTKNPCVQYALDQANEAKKNSTIIFTVGFHLENVQNPYTPQSARELLSAISTNGVNFRESISLTSLATIFNVVDEIEKTPGDCLNTKLFVPLPKYIDFVSNSFNPLASQSFGREARWDLGRVQGQRQVQFSIALDSRRQFAGDAIYFSYQDEFGNSLIKYLSPENIVSFACEDKYSTSFYYCQQKDNSCSLAGRYFSAEECKAKTGKECQTQELCSRACKNSEPGPSTPAEQEPEPHADIPPAPPVPKTEPPKFSYLECQPDPVNGGLKVSARIDSVGGFSPMRSFIWGYEKEKGKECAKAGKDNCVYAGLKDNINSPAAISGNVLYDGGKPLIPGKEYCFEIKGIANNGKGEQKSVAAVPNVCCQAPSLSISDPVCAKIAPTSINLKAQVGPVSGVSDTISAWMWGWPIGSSFKPIYNIGYTQNIRKIQEIKGTANNLTPDTLYCFEARAKNSAGEYVASQQNTCCKTTQGISFSDLKCNVNFDNSISLRADISAPAYESVNAWFFDEKNKLYSLGNNSYKGVAQINATTGILPEKKEYCFYARAKAKEQDSAGKWKDVYFTSEKSVCCKTKDNLNPPQEVLSPEDKCKGLNIFLLCDEKTTRPKDILLVLDASQSMGEEGKFSALKQGVKAFIDSSVFDKNKDRIGIITFSSDADVQQQLASVSNTKIIKQTVDSLLIRNEDTTRFSAGLIAAEMEFFGNRNNPGSEKIIIFFTDGQAYERYQYKYISAFLREMGIKIFTVGLGKNITYGDVSYLSDGELYFHAEEVSKIKDIFVEISEILVYDKICPDPQLEIFFKSKVSQIEFSTKGEYDKKMFVNKDSLKLKINPFSGYKSIFFNIPGGEIKSYKDVKNVVLTYGDKAVNVPIQNVNIGGCAGSIYEDRKDIDYKPVNSFTKAPSDFGATCEIRGFEESKQVLDDKIAENNEYLYVGYKIKLGKEASGFTGFMKREYFYRTLGIPQVAKEPEFAFVVNGEISDELIFYQFISDKTNFSFQNKITLMRSGTTGYEYVTCESKK